MNDSSSSVRALSDWSRGFPVRRPTVVARGQALLLLAASLTFHASALTAAQTPVAADASPALGQSKAFFEQGVGFSKSGRWRDALEAFESAWALAHRSTTAFNLAAVRYRLGEYVEARDALAAYEELAPPDEPRRSDADRLRTLIDRLLIRVALRVSPDTAEVKVDGELQTGSGTLRRFDVDPGGHYLQVAAAGYESVEERFMAKPGGDLNLSFSLKKKSVSVLPLSSVDKPTERGERTWPAQRWVGVGIGGAGLLGVALGGVFGSLALTKKADSKVDCDADNVCGAQGYGDVQAARRWGNAATVAAIAGAALLGGAGVLFFTARDDVDTTADSVAILPTISAHRLGLEVHRSF